jgi:hypothetical protein
MKYIYALVLVLFIIGCGGSTIEPAADNAKTLPDEEPAKTQPIIEPKPMCINQCGDGNCDEMVCQGEGCPCAETVSSCPIDCKVEEPEPVVPKEPEKTNDPIVAELMEKAKKIKSKSPGGLKYHYSTSDTSLKYQVADEVIVKQLGGKISIDYGRLMEDDDGFRYTFLYSDNSTKEAYLLCGENEINCRNGFEAKKIPFEDAMLPPDPLKQLDTLTSAKIHMEQRFNGKETVILEEDRDGYMLRLYVWVYHGVPIHIEKNYGDKITEERYQEMSANSVRDEDVTLPAGVSILE